MLSQLTLAPFQFLICQLCMHIKAHSTPAEIWHGHDLYHQTGPTSKVLRALAHARLSVVLLPCETRLLPVLVDVLDEEKAELGV